MRMYLNISEQNGMLNNIVQLLDTQRKLIGGYNQKGLDAYNGEDLSKYDNPSRASV